MARLFNSRRPAGAGPESRAFPQRPVESGVAAAAPEPAPWRAGVEYCATDEHERFGVIDFAVSADVTDAFRVAGRKIRDEDWNTRHQLEKGQMVAMGQQ